jgi:3-deoxy-D-manno-octulosonate 8-phosphate phosphatase (KDO 8-P phosphatase)
MLIEAGTAVALLSGRDSAAVGKRAAELGIAHVLQGIDDKKAAFEALAGRLGVPAAEAGFMGDEVVDLPVLSRCGFACAPGEAREQVRAQAHYVASTPAGYGAAREVCEFVMHAQGTLARALRGHAA